MRNTLGNLSAKGRAPHSAIKESARQLVALLAASALLLGQSSKSVIIPSGSTATTLSTSGNVTNITTGTVRGSNAYNSFNAFNEAQGSTVNLLLPTGTNSLLNLVNSQATIDGTLNSILNGQIGGNVFFADPYGIIIGKSGVVNVGAFVGLTPTASFLNQFFLSPGNPSQAATAGILNGTVPISPSGLISVQGTINATQNIGLFGGSINNSGTIASGAVFTAAKPDFSDVVNVSGLKSGTAIVVQNGSINIQAAEDFENSGTITSSGNQNVSAGNLSIQAGNNVKLDAGSLLSAAGSGTNSNGGTISVRAGQNAEIDSGALVTAAAGTSGNGGDIDLSATGTLNFNGGQLKAGAANGLPGTVTIDPTDLNITSNMTPNDGTSIALTGDTITIAPGIIVSSRQIGTGADFVNSPSTGNSGSISLTANSSVETSKITIGDGADILAQASNGFSAGNVTLQATQSLAASIVTSGAQINVGNALIEGQNVTLTSTATATANSTPFGPTSGILNNTSLGFLVNGPASVNTSSATSGITIGNAATSGTAHINATGNVSITSTATAGTTSDLTGTAGFAYGESDSSATAQVANTATINAAGTFALNAASNNTLSVSETTTQQAQSTLAVAFGKTSSISVAQVDGSVTGSSVQIASTNQNSFSTKASPTDYGTTTGNGGGVGIALGFYDSNATTNVTGSATSTQTDAQISSSSTNTQNLVNSSSSVPSSGLKSKIASAEGWAQNLGNRLSQATVTGILGSSPAVNQEANPQTLGLAAAISIADTGNYATTNVTGTVKSQGKATITSLAVDNPQIDAAGSVGGEATDIGGAIAVSDFKNTADTYVDGSAVVTGASAVSITAEADILNPALQTAGVIENDFNFQGVNFSGPIVNSGKTGWGDALLADIEGVANGITTPLKAVANPGLFTTSFVNTGLSTSATSTSASQYGFAGSVDLMGMTNQSTASVTGSASVTANTGDLSVNATSNVTTINASGMAFGVGQLASLNPGVNSGTSVGGSFYGLNLTNTSTAYIGDGTTATATQGNVSVVANSQTLAVNAVQAGEKATQFGITGTFDLTNLTDNAEAYIQSNATVTAAQNVNVNAVNVLSDFTVGGALGSGGSAQVGVAVDWNEISDTTLAYIGDPGNARTTICPGCGVTAGQSVNVTPTSTENVYSVTFAAAASGNSGKGADGESAATPTGEQAAAAPTTFGPSEAQNGAGGGAFGFGISGDIAFNQLASLSGNPGIVTQGFINNGANVTATAGTVNVTAQDTSFVVAAGLAATLGQLTSLAGAYSQNTINKDVEAFTTNTTVAGNALTLNAIGNGSLFAVTAGGAVNTEEGISVAGSVNNESITNKVNASLGDDTSATGIGLGGVSVSASEGPNGDQMVSVAGGFSASAGGDGVGAAVDMGTFTNNVTASIGAAQVNTAGNVQVTSSTNVSYLPIAASLAVGSTFIAAGSVADESITDTTTSSVTGTVNAGQNLVIGSGDSSSATIIAGGAGFGGEVGVGVAAILPQFLRTTVAEIANGAIVSADGSASSPATYGSQSVNGILLDATTTGSLSDYAVAGAGSGSTSIAGAVIVNQFGQSIPNTLKDDTEATIGQNASVDALTQNLVAGQSVKLLASDTSGITDAAGMLAVGADLGIGVGFDQIVPEWTVNTSIGSGTTLNAAANVIVSSTLQNSVSSYAVSGSASAGAAGAAAASVINETSNTTASIEGTVDTGGSVQISASRNTAKLNSTDGDLAVAVSLGAGLGASVANTTTDDTVDAAIGGTASVTALGGLSPISAPTGQLDGNGNPLTSNFNGISVTAVSSTSASPTAAGGAGSGAVGAQGSVQTANLTEITTAEIDPLASVNFNNTGAAAAQTVQVLATDQTKLTSIAGSVAGGAAALSAAVDSDTVNRTVTADISGATVNAMNNVAVAGQTLGSVSSIAASGSAGGFAAAGAVSNISDTANTYAYITGAANVTAQDNVEIAANRNTSISATDGSGAFGGDGLNGSIANVTQNNTTDAYVGPGTSVAALALGTGLSVPVANSSGVLTTGLVNGLSVTAVGSETLGTLVVGASVSASASVSGSVTNAKYTEDTSALIDPGATINGSNASAGASQSVNVLAADTTTPTTADGTLGASLGLGVGAAVDLENIQKNTTAGIGNGVLVNANNAVTVNALSQEIMKSYTASVAVGLASASGTSADYQTHPITPTTDAYIGSATLNAGSVTVNANDNLSLTAISGEASVGGVAFGASTVLATVDGNTSAAVNQVAALSATGNVKVGSTFTETLNGSAYSGGGGFVSADAAYTSLTDNSTNAANLGGTVPEAGSISVTATTTRTLTATSAGLSIGNLSGGAAIASTTSDGATNAFASGNLGQTAGESVNSLALNATDNTTATSTSAALSAGIGSGEFNQATANVANSVDSGIGSGANLNLASQLSVNAGATDTSTSTVVGGNFGAITVGAATSQASSTSNVSAYLGDNVNVTAPTVTVSADYQSLGVSATSHMAAGSLVNIGAGTSSAIANDSPVVSAYAGDSNNNASTVNGGTINIGTQSNTSASADFEGNDYAGVNIPGNSVATANINNDNQVWTGPNVTLNGASATVLVASSSNNLPVVKDIASSGGLISVGGNSDGSTANACINSPGACGFSGPAGGTSVVIGAGSILAGVATVVRAYSTDSANNVLSEGTVDAGIATNNNFANETINDSPSITIANATINSNSAVVDAEVTGLLANSEANSITSAAGSASISTSTMNVTANPSVTIANSTINSPGSIYINTDVADSSSAVQSSNLATASINGFTGSITATATNNSSYLPAILLSGNNILTTSNLDVSSSSPIPPNASGTNSTNPFYTNNANAQNNTVVSWVLTTVQETVDEAVGWIPFFGSLIESVTKDVTEWVEKVTDSSTSNVLNGQFLSQPDISLNAKLYQTGSMGASLTATPGPNNQATFSGTGITAANDGLGDIIVSNILNSGTETVSLNAPSGSIAGALSIYRDSSFPTINLTNNTGENLIINQIQPLSTNAGTPDITENAANTSGFTSTFQSTAGPTIITVQNNSASNVIFEDYINNPSGVIKVNNTGGSILGTANDLLEDNQASFVAAGNVGTLENPLNIRMSADPNPLAPQLSAQAGVNVDINATMTGYEIAAPGPSLMLGPADITSITAGGAVNLNLATPVALVAQPNRTFTSYNTNGSYEIGTVTANGLVSITAPADLLTVSNVTSTASNVDISAGASVTLASVTATAGSANINASGSILPSSSGTNVSAAQIQLNAGANIGTNGDPLGIQATGLVGTSSTSGVYLNQSSADLHLGSINNTGGNAVITADGGSIYLGSIQSPAGNTTLTSSGSILNSGTAPDITSENVILTSQNGSIGTAGTPVTITATGQLIAQANQDADISEVLGNSNVTSIVSTNGNVMLTDQGGNVNLGTITALKGNTSVTATQGSILNAGNPVNISSGNVTLNAQEGPIGATVAPLNIIATGQLTAQAIQDADITQVAGNLAVNSVTSSTGSVNLNVPAGDADLGVIASPGGNTVVSASGSILNATSQTNITAGSLNLNAQNGSIGTSAAPVNIDVAGQVTAQANQSVNLAAVLGNLNVNSITSTKGNVVLTDASGNVNLGAVTATAGTTAIIATQGGILNTGTGVNVASGNITLTADAGPIGSATAPVTIDATGQLNAQATQSVFINQIGNSLAVNSVGSATGNVNLDVLNGDADLGAIAAANGNTSIIASGSILNATNQTNVVTKNLSLTATNGSIGAALPLAVNASGQLTAVAKQGVTIQQTTGAMNASSVTSQTGSVNLTAPAGSINLGVVNATAGNTTILASQSITDSGNTGASNINSQNINLTAQTGAIGATTAPVDIDATGALTAQAQQGIYITQTTGNLNLNTVTSNTGSVALAAAAGNVDLGTINAKAANTNITASGSILDTNSTAASAINTVNATLTAQNGSVGSSAVPIDLDATGVISAQGNQGVFLTQTAGSINVGTISSPTGSIALTSSTGNVNLGTVNALAGNTSLTAYGSILDTNKTSASTINSQAVNLTAQHGTIGTGSNPLEIDATGQVSAQALQSAYLTQTTGNFNVNTVTSTTGNVTLAAAAGGLNLGTVNALEGNTSISASGSILDTNHSSASDINTNYLVLYSTAGSIGASTDLLNIDSNYGNLFLPGNVNAAAKLGVYLNQVKGAMFVDQISSQTSDVTLSSQGSIINDLGFCPLCTNVVANNTTFTSAAGSIGQSYNPILVYNRNPSSGTSGSYYLNASALADIYATEVQGNLLSNSISSQAGNIGLLALNGNGSLNQILGTQSVSVQVNGNLLNIQNIGAPAGSTSTYKAPSPNNVSLFVRTPGGSLTVNKLSAYQSITTQADYTTLSSVIATNLASPQSLSARQANALVLSMTGSNGGVANVLNATIAPCTGCQLTTPVIFNQYWTNTGTVTANMDWLEFGNAVVGNNALFQNDYLKVKVTNTNTHHPYSSWQLFVIGDQAQTNAPPGVNVSGSLLNPNKHYTWPFTPSQVFNYLWEYFGY